MIVMNTEAIVAACVIGACLIAWMILHIGACLIAWMIFHKDR